MVCRCCAFAVLWLPLFSCFSCFSGLSCFAASHAYNDFDVVRQISFSTTVAVCAPRWAIAKVNQELLRSAKNHVGPTHLPEIHPTHFSSHVTDSRPSNARGAAAVSRRMTSQIRSGPVGARGVFNFKLAFPICYIYLLSKLAQPGFRSGPGGKG